MSVISYYTVENITHYIYTLSELNTKQLPWPGYLTVHDSVGPAESCTVRYPGQGQGPRGVMHRKVSLLFTVHRTHRSLIKINKHKVIANMKNGLQ